MLSPKGDKSAKLVYFSVFFVFSDNPVIRTLNLPAILFFVAFFCFYLLNFFTSKKPDNGVLYRCILYVLFLFTALSTSLYNQTHVPLMFAALAVAYSEYIFSLSIATIVNIIYVCSSILYYTCLLALLAVLCNVIGLPSWFQYGPLSFQPVSFLYPTTNSIMRAAGFMYEPGQLSFYICYVCASREIFGFRRKRTLMLLALGFLTQSLSHLIFCIGFVIYLLLKRGNSYQKLTSLISTIAIGIIIYQFSIFEWMSGRASDFYDNPEQWGRFNSFNFALNRLDDSWTNILWGPSSSLAARKLEINESFSSELENVSIYGENPLSPLMTGGLFSCWPFYLFIFMSLWWSLSRGANGFLILSCALLTLQRPYTLEFPYTFIICICLRSLFIGSVKDHLAKKFD